MNSARMYAEVVDDIRTASSRYPSDLPRFACITRHGTRLSCPNDPEAISSLVNKYEKASKRCPRELTAPITIPASTRSKSAGLNDFVKGNEIKNAIEYADLTGQHVYFYRSFTKDVGPVPLSSPEVQKDTRFVLGRSPCARWAIVHIESGRVCAIKSTKGAAIRKHADDLARLTTTQVGEIVAQLDTDFQDKAKQHFTNKK